MEVQPRYQGMSKLDKLSPDELRRMAEAANVSVKEMKKILLETEQHAEDIKKTYKDWNQGGKTIRLFTGGKPENPFPEGGQQIKLSSPTKIKLGQEAATQQEFGRKAA